MLWRADEHADDVWVGKTGHTRPARLMEASPMLELVWFLLASIPFVTGLTFVLLVLRERWQRGAVRERADVDRR